MDAAAPPSCPPSPTIDAEVSPEGSMEMLSQQEVNQLLDTSRGGLYELYRRCSLAVLNTGGDTDDSRLILEQFQDFDVRILRRPRGIKLKLENAPADAFVDGAIIRGIGEHLYAVLRDLLYTRNEILDSGCFDLSRPADITNAVFRILRNAGILRPGILNLVVCWGGHSISSEEYDYSKRVGYELGLRGLDICTGCGPGAMKAPMKGAALGHAKQRRIDKARFVGITEPGIIAAEPPNPIVNELTIMPDIEKRLEAFVRAGHGVIVFPGGAGTAEEILHLLGILLHPDNAGIPFPLLFAGPEVSRGYFQMIDTFLGATLGDAARRRYRIIIGDPAETARAMKHGIRRVREYRNEKRDAYHFNWQLRIEPEFQLPFAPTHANMAALALHRDQPVHRLAAELRKAFSGIVAGNVKEAGIGAVEAHGPFELRGDPSVIHPLGELLQAFASQQRMKLPGSAYMPSYRVVSTPG